MKPRKTKSTAFVPSVVFGTVFAGVVPACALAACGSDSTSGGGGSDASSDTRSDVPFQDEALMGVGACCFEASVQDTSLDAGKDATDADARLGVADVGFGG